MHFNIYVFLKASQIVQVSGTVKLALTFLLIIHTWFVSQRHTCDLLKTFTPRCAFSGTHRGIPNSVCTIWICTYILTFSSVNLYISNLFLTELVNKLRNEAGFLNPPNISAPKHRIKFISSMVHNIWMWLTTIGLSC